MKWLWLFLPIMAMASEMDTWSERWMAGIRIEDRHEGYNSGEMLKKPAGTWQLLLSIVLPNDEKDCLFVRIPEKNDGEIKVVTVDAATECKSAQQTMARISLKQLKAIQYQLDGQHLKIWPTDLSGRVQKWQTKLLNIERPLVPELHHSSNTR